MKRIVGDWLSSNSVDTKTRDLKHAQELLSSSIQKIAQKIQDLSTNSTDLMSKVNKLIHDQTKLKTTISTTKCTANQSSILSEPSSATLQTV